MSLPNFAERGRWSILQAPVRSLPAKRVAIPQRFYKILLRHFAPAPPEPLAIVLPNLAVRPVAVTPGKQTTRTVAEAYLAAHTVSVREIEHLTGLDLLPTLDAEDLKQAVASELWPRN